jgi:hypothetical protein
MDMKEWTSGAGAPQTKPWLTPVAYSMEVVGLTAQTVTAQDVTQKNGRPTPYGLWSTLGSQTVTNTGGVPALLMNSFVGVVTIPAADVVAGMTTRVHVYGKLTTVGLGLRTAKFSIRDISGAILHEELQIDHSVAVADVPFKVEFNLKVSTPGGPGVGVEDNAAAAQIKNGVVEVVNVTTNSTTFDSTGGVQYALFVDATANMTVVRQSASAVVEYN